VREKAQQPEGSSILHCVVLHEQTFYPFELEARLARSVVVFDPRHALIPQVFFCHGALHGSGAPNTTRRRGIHYSNRVPSNCELLHMVNYFFRSAEEEIPEADTVHGYRVTGHGNLTRKGSRIRDCGWSFRWAGIGRHAVGRELRERRPKVRKLSGRNLGAHAALDH
jgi:hypothetical protein